MSFMVDIQFSTSLVLLFAIIHRCTFTFWCMLQTYRSSMCSHFYRNLFIHFYVSTFIVRGVVPTWFLDQHYFEMRTLLCLSLKRTNTQCFPLKICGRQLSLRYCEKYRLLFIIWHINFFLLYVISTEMNKNENVNDTLFLTANNRWTTSSSINIKQHHINLNSLRPKFFDGCLFWRDICQKFSVLRDVHQNFSLSTNFAWAIPNPEL